MIVHGGEREPQAEAAVSFRTVVTFVTWLIYRTEFSSLEIVIVGALVTWAIYTQGQLLL